MRKVKFSHETVRVVIVGHVDHGKSTLIGRLIFELDQIQDGRYEELKKKLVIKGGWYLNGHF